MCKHRYVVFSTHHTPMHMIWSVGWWDQWTIHPLLIYLDKALSSDKEEERIFSFTPRWLQSSGFTPFSRNFWLDGKQWHTKLDILGGTVQIYCSPRVHGIDGKSEIWTCLQNVENFISSKKSYICWTKLFLNMTMNI